MSFSNSKFVKTNFFKTYTGVKEKDEELLTLLARNLK
tara:strand:- start:189 stop:299 length:111 start_codon:yes stop_codon:yes gene_type:complete